MKQFSVILQFKKDMKIVLKGNSFFFCRKSNFYKKQATLNLTAYL